MSDARNELAAPLSSATAGYLKFVGGADSVTIRADVSAAEDLYRARFGGTVPSVHAEDGAVGIEYPRAWNPLNWRRYSADVALNARVPWRIAVDGGVSGLDADLSGLRLESFGVDGGAGDVDLMLPEPSGTVSIRIEGGVNNLCVRRPRSVAARVHVEGGAGKLALDGQRFGTDVCEATMESPSYAGATDRYEIVVGGGANSVSVSPRKLGHELRGAGVP